MPIEVGLEDVLAQRYALIRPELVEAELLPGLLGALDDAGARVAVEAVAVDPDLPGARLLEGEGEGVEELVGAEPDELVGAHVHVGLKPVLVELAHPAGDAVASDDQVG